MVIQIPELTTLNIFGNAETERIENADLEQRTEGLIRKNYKKYLGNQFKKYAADTFAGQTFHQPLFFSIELFTMHYFGRMELSQSLHSRRNAFFIGLAANRVYGVFGDYWEKLWKTLGENSERGRRIVDGSGKVLFEAGLYAGNLAINGVKAEDMYIAVPLGLAVHFGLGHEYRKYQNYIRRKFKVQMRSF